MAPLPGAGVAAGWLAVEVGLAGWVAAGGLAVGAGGLGAGGGGLAAFAGGHGDGQQNGHKGKDGAAHAGLLLVGKT